MIDSDILIGIERNDEDIVAWVSAREDAAVFLSIISASELIHGVYRAKSLAIRAKRRAFVESVLASLSILGIDLATARCHADLWS